MIFRDKYWTESFLKDLEFTRSFGDVAFIAKSVIKTIPKPVFGLFSSFNYRWLWVGK